MFNETWLDSVNRSHILSSCILLAICNASCWSFVDSALWWIVLRSRSVCADSMRCCNVEEFSTTRIKAVLPWQSLWDMPPGKRGARAQNMAGLHCIDARCRIFSPFALRWWRCVSMPSCCSKYSTTPIWPARTASQSTGGLDRSSFVAGAEARAVAPS